jgi:chemotaxis protein MotB
MKYLFFLTIFFSISSCVSTKKYKRLESSYNQSLIDLQHSQSKIVECEIKTQDCMQNIQNLESKLTSVNNECRIKDIHLETAKNENKLKDERVKDLEKHIDFIKSSNQELTNRVDGLSASNKVNVDIMKKLLEEQEIQQLKVLNLSLALQKQDSLNIHLVKKSKRNISDDKLKRTLEKLGFVFF